MFAKFFISYSNSFSIISNQEDNHTKYRIYCGINDLQCHNWVACLLNWLLLKYDYLKNYMKNNVYTLNSLESNASLENESTLVFNEMNSIQWSQIGVH